MGSVLRRPMHVSGAPLKRMLSGRDDWTHPGSCSDAPKSTGGDGKPQNFAQLSREEWKERLTPMQFDVTRNAATERNPQRLYSLKFGFLMHSSETKFDSGCGWPSFSDAIDEGNIVTRPDHSLDMIRTEVICKHCNAHLGHVFDDGPKPTYLRYCINGAALKFVPAK